MRGLLIKDLKILSQQKRIWILMIFITMIMLFTGSDLSFLVGYVTMLTVIMTLSTISYDEMDNGFTYLFTLPVDVKGYVMTKYLLSFAVSLIVWGATNVVLILASEESYGMEDFFGAVLLLLIAFLMQFVMIPLQLKFGAEKSRIVYLLIVGIGVLLGWLVSEFSVYLPNLSGMVAWIEGLKFVEIAGLSALFTAMVGLISFVSSCKVMDRKKL